MSQENSIDWFSAYSAGLTGKEEALKQALKSYGYTTKMPKIVGAASYASDAIRGAGALLQGDYDEAGRRTASAIGGGIGGALGAWVGSMFIPIAPVAAPIMAGFGSYYGSQAGEYLYSNTGDALRWTGNTVEGGIRDYTQNTISPWAQYFAESATESLQPLVTKWSDGLQGVANDYGPGLESRTKTMSGAIESATKAISTFAESGTKALVKLFGADNPESYTSSKADTDSSYTGSENGKLGTPYLDLSTWIDTPSRYKFDADSFGISTPTLDFFTSASAPESALTTQTIRNATPNTVALPYRDSSYLNMGDFFFPDTPDSASMSAAEQAFLDKLEQQAALEAANMLPDDWQERLYPAYDDALGGMDWQAADEQAKRIGAYPVQVPSGGQPSVIDYAGSAINTAYNVMSFGSTLQDVLTGRRSDPGAYLSLANSTVQGLSWLSKTDGVKDIVSAIGDLQDPLDTMAGVTGGAVAGWGLYQNIAGLANGEVNAQNVLGAVANSSALYQTAFKPLPTRALPLAA